MLDVRTILRRGIAMQESGGEEDPWTRTRLSKTLGGSTAYGPLQITGSTLDDLTDEQLELKGLSKLTDSEKKLIKKLKDQAKKFNEYGNEQDKEGYDSRYDYGGSGEGLTSEEKSTYWDLGDRLFRLKASYRGYDADRLDPVQEAEVIGDWYGRDREFTPEYTASVLDHLKQYRGDGMISRNPYPHNPRPI